MRTATVEVERVAIPFVTPLESGAGRWSGLRSAIVTLRTDSGIEGLGEMVPANDQVRLPLADVLVGLSLTDDAEVEAALLEIERIPGDGDAGAGRAARSAVASAIVDTLARADGRSAARMLAPAPRADVAVNALIGRISPDQAASRAGAFVRAGFGCLKVKGGGEPEDAIVARLAAVRAAVGADVALRLDLNGSLE